VPELPEVETVVRQLDPLVRDRCVKQIRLFDPLLGKPRVGAARGRRVVSVLRVGKQVVFALDGGQVGHRVASLWLSVHLRMTGRLLWCPSAPRAAVPHLRARMTLDRGCVQFVDTRRFGTLSVHSSVTELEGDGLDPTHPNFTVEVLTDLLQRGSGAQSIKTWLLRQDRLVGLGNIYACEILFEAGIDPAQAAGRLRPKQIGRLHTATVDVLQRAIANCGTTFSDFQDVRGVTGSYQQFLKVYQREGRACPQCRTAVRRIVQQQRSTFFCPRCQRRARTCTLR